MLETGATLNAPTIEGPVCDHRKAHKPGRPAKLDTDAELRAFVVARLDRLTFMAISAEVKANFPPHRHIGHSAFHAWYRRTYG